MKALKHKGLKIILKLKLTFFLQKIVLKFLLFRNQLP